MLEIKFNGAMYKAGKRFTAIAFSRAIGVELPQYCYHDTLPISGNCRICMIELEEIERISKKFIPVNACSYLLNDGLVGIFTDSLRAHKARNSVTTSLLLNHPLDCPICDQAGDCDLQDQSKKYGAEFNKYLINRRGVLNKNCGVLIKTIMTRCIHCTRCVRFGEAIAGVNFFGTINRGTRTDVGTYLSKDFFSEISGNVIDLCPVGALTSNSFRFKARSWELKVTETVDSTDSVGSQIKVSTKGSWIARIAAKKSNNINTSLISDSARFSYDNHQSSFRIKQNYIYNSELNQYKNASILNFLTNYEQNSFEEVSKDININFNEDIGFDEISFLKSLANNRNNVCINSLNSHYFINNFSILNFENKINDLSKNSVNFYSHNLGIVLGFNPRVECSSINFRLRRLFSKSTNNLLGAGLFSNVNNLDCNFINLNNKKIFTLFEGKYTNLSKNFIRAASAYLFVNENIFKRGVDSFSFGAYVKTFFNTLSYVKVGSTANSSALTFFNIKNIGSEIKKNFNINSTKFLNINNTDTVNFRSKFLKFSKSMIWFNNYYSDIINKFGVSAIVSTPADFESNRVLLSMENRFQNFTKITQKFYNSQKVSEFTSLLFFGVRNKFLVKNPSFFFVQESVSNPLFFNFFKSKFNSLLGTTNLNLDLSTSYLFSYPVKINTEDFGAITKTGRNSFNMFTVYNSYKAQQVNFLQS